ncbi:P-loop containing nucleoside triphosphate hydrolase protein, partial [Cantharellus anzutake]|uniref:P-loop containing nucleoside triphosphate hydrolase protein n=1 Tax=Cantharellus anzutake TaxID=1750568 RepID=UPI0019039CCC
MPSAEQIRALSEAEWNRCACWFQAEIAEFLLCEPKQNLVSTAATGTGKTYTFFLPALYEKKKPGVSFIIAPLRKLADQHVESAEKLGLTAIALEARTINKDAIASMRYQFVVLGPDLLRGNLLRPLWMKDSFVSNINRIIVDEAHCAVQWLSFRTKYTNLAWLYSYLRNRCQWYLTSATLDPRTCRKVLSAIGMDPYYSDHGGETTKWLRRSNDRPNLHYCVRQMQYSKDSCNDLAFLVPLGLKESDPLPKPFLVYCESRADAERSAGFLRSRVCTMLRNRIIWVHSGMSDGHKLMAVKLLKEGKLIGLTSTESLGLGHDLANITCLVQFGPPDNLNTLTQRFGRAARNPETAAIVILLAPKEYFEGTRQRREERARK